MVDYAQVFKDSFARVTDSERREGFLDAFYSRFIAADPQIANKFRDTDLPHQKKMLWESLSEMVDFFLTHQSNPFLVTLSRIHGVRGHKVPPELYDVWLTCLVRAVEEFDPEWSDSAALAWRIVMAPGIEFMKFYRDR